MPLLLTRSQLAPLAEDDGALDGALDAVEAALLRSHQEDPGESIFAGLNLANGDEFAVNVGALAHGPASVRLFPKDFRGARTNAWVGVQIDGSRGEIDSLVALDDLNVLRTAVPAALGARHLAAPGATTLAILGSGLQARSQARTFARVLPNLTDLRVWSPTREHREAFGAEIAERTGLSVTCCSSAEDAVAGADVVTAAGRLAGGVPAVVPASVPAGALVVSLTASGIGLLRLGARLVVPTAKAPELVAHGFSSGFLREKPPPAPPPALQLADVVAGAVPARTAPDQTLVYELAGAYLWDLPILEWITGWAAAHGVGTMIDLSS
jgi:alanine dehydrogenase